LFFAFHPLLYLDGYLGLLFSAVVRDEEEEDEDS
jgi:hypothetical protein